jgi:mono/diheme cytochrome c family protein
MPIFGNGWGRGQRPTARLQSRNAVSALGQRESFATYVGVWFAGITIGVVLFLAIAGLNIFNGDRPTPGNLSTSDRNSLNLISNRPASDRQALVQEGYQVFVAQGCQACHQQGGYGIKGQGPRLQYSGNARDAQYVKSIVRWGYAPMPAYPVTQLSDADLYKIVAYLHYIQENRTQIPSFVQQQ